MCSKNSKCDLKVKVWRGFVGIILPTWPRHKTRSNIANVENLKKIGKSFMRVIGESFIGNKIYKRSREREIKIEF